MTQRVFSKRHALVHSALVFTAVAQVSCVRAEPPELRSAITVAETGATHPTVAIDAASGAQYVAWVGTHEGMPNVYISRSADGATFDAPIRVNDIAGDAAPHEQAPAQVAIAPDGTVYVVWQNNQHVEGRRFPYSDLRLARSTDGGRTFEPAITVNDDVTLGPSSHTFHDLIVGRNGSVYVSWIDGRMRASAERDLAASASAAGDSAVISGHGGHGMENLPPQEIRLAWSTDGGRSFGPSTVVAEDPCPCCRTSLAIADDGSILLGWRGIFAGSVRDVVIARSTDGGATFGEAVRVHNDGWQIDGCPHAGPSIATTADGRVHVAWYTGAPDGPGVFHAVSRDGGLTFGEAQPLLAGDWVPVSRVHLAAAGNRILGVWDDVRTDPAQPRVGWVTEDRVAADTLGAGGTFPVVAATAERSIVAWLDGDRIRVRTTAISAQPNDGVVESARQP